FDFQGCGTRVACSLKGARLPLGMLNRAERSLRLLVFVFGRSETCCACWELYTRTRRRKRGF
ncbi:hypothetical protein T440DRAFT_399918, partial [Plenodomus tracheiphilus IPT5]